MNSNEGKPLIENANENRNQLIESVRNKIAELENIIIDINSEENKIICNCTRDAEQTDVRYVPNRDVIQDFSKLKGDLCDVEKRLQTLTLTEDTIFDEDKYLIAAEQIMERIEDIIKEKMESFKKANEETLEKNSYQKVELQMKLADSRLELNHVNSEKEKVEEETNKIKRGIVYRIKISIFKKEDPEIIENNDKIIELEKKKKDLEAKISKLEIQEKAQHFVAEERSEDEYKEEKEDLEVQK